MRYLQKYLGCFSIFCLALTFQIEAQSSSYPKNPRVKQSIWRELAPHFLPDDHPAKDTLDALFASSRITLSPRTLKKAGFINPNPRKWTHLIVTKHPELEGYVVKLYTDSQRHSKDKREFWFWQQRIRGAQAIQALIDKHEWNHLFKVPKKWVYPLPEDPAPPKGLYRKNFILIEEDMQICKDKENQELWKSDEINEEMLEKLYFILDELGLRDCAKPDNVPFCEDGRIAFVDTQTFDEKPVHYEKMTPYLSREMKCYWKYLTSKKKKQGRT